VLEHLRARSSAVRGFSVALLHNEYTDEVVLEYMPVDLQTNGGMFSWRLCPKSDLSVHGYRMCPMMNVVHAGRFFSWGINEHFSNGLLAPTYRNNTVMGGTFSDDVVRFAGFWLGVDWPLGIQLPVFSQYMDADAATDGTSYDLWNENEYADDAAGGPANPAIRLQRDMAISILRADVRWLREYMPNGRMMPPLTLEAQTTLVTGLHGSTADSGSGPIDINIRNSCPNIYPVDAFPAITHAVWQHRTNGRICIPLCNWTENSADIDWVADLALYGLPTNLPVSVFQVSADGNPTLVGSFTGATIQLRTTLGAYTIGAIMLVATSDTAEIQPEVTDLQVRATLNPGELKITWQMPVPSVSDNSKYLYPVVQEVILMRKQSGYPQNETDGIEVYRGTASEFLDTGLQPGVAYHYSCLVEDGGELSTT